MNLFPLTGEPIPSAFLLNPSKVQACSQYVDREKIQNTLFVIPQNDGEALRAVQILKSLSAPHLRVSAQPWGAHLNTEGLLLENIPVEVKTIAILEIPGPEQETEIKKRFELLIFDHHCYEDLDRSHKLSSLEQLCQWIGWKMDAQDQAISVNDRSYIRGLSIELSLDRKQIEEIRLFDLQAQGNKLKNILKSITRSRELIHKMERWGADIHVMKKMGESHLIIKQELSIQHLDQPCNIVEIAKSKIGFSGDPHLAQALFEIQYDKYGYTHGNYKKYLGGDPRYSQFFNFKALQAPFDSKELLSSDLLRDVKKLLMGRSHRS